MENVLGRINFDEAEFFYKSPLALVDYGNMQSFSLIKSVVEVFAYYGITDFSAEDICSFFERLQLTQKKFDRVFVPSPKKVNGVMDCCTGYGRNRLSINGSSYHIESWDSTGYGFEIKAARETGKIQ